MTHKTNHIKITALYERLSIGDEKRGNEESNSIQNQKIQLEAYAKENGFTNIRHYTDDDESGRFFDRTGYSRMMEEVEQGKIGIVL
jgi:DNA invertase Pin-like site-specific DNA recombinase